MLPVFGWCPRTDCIAGREPLIFVSGLFPDALTDCFGRFCHVLFGSLRSFPMLLIKTLSTSLASAALMGPILAQNYELDRIWPNSGSDGQGFGVGIAVSGDLILVSAPSFRDMGIPLVGTAYLFSRSTGSQVGQLFAPTPSALLYFGYDVDLNGRIALIGARGGDSLGVSTGSAYLIDTSDSSILQHLLAPDGIGSDHYGTSVAFFGSDVLVGAPDHSAGGVQDSGAVYHHSAATGQMLGKILPSDPAPSMQFGWSIAVCEEWALIGAQAFSGGGPHHGAAYLFDALTLQEVVKLQPPQPISLQAFGRSVAVSKEYALVGAPNDPTRGVDAGAAFLFSLPSGQLLAQLDPPELEAGDLFGASVALDGDRALIGAPGDGTFAYQAGAVYVFDTSSAALRSKTIARDGGDRHLLGLRVLAADGLGFACAAGSDEVGFNTGSLCTIDLNQVVDNGTAFCFGDGAGAACPCTPHPNPSSGEGCSNSLDGGGRLAAYGQAVLSNDDLVFVVSDVPHGGILIRGSNRVGGGLGSPAADGLLCINGDIRRSQFFDATSAGAIDNFRGQPLGSTNHAPGLPDLYQFWYRDPENSCSGQSFNFTNAWAVTWTP